MRFPWDALLLAAVLLPPARAAAGGMVLPVRGVRTLERGGAFVAGADDADALWLDPAGLAHVHGKGTKAFLFDIAYIFQPIDYTRIDAAGAPLPAVTNQQPGSPAPTIAAAIALDDRLVLAAGLTTPYAGTPRYAEDGPQRYAAVGLAGSSFVLVTFGAAYALTDQLRVGATVQDLVSTLDARITLSACATAACAAEDKSYDSLAHIHQADYLAPSGSIGIQYDALRELTLGLALQAPTRIASTGTFELQLPTNMMFTGARVVGDRASTSFTLPPIARLGIEYHPMAALRVEAALEVELWSMHDTIEIEPRDVHVDTQAGSFPIGTLTIPRHYKTTFSPALGVEYHTGPAMFGAGIAYETAAAPPAYVSALTVDAAKLLVGLGGGYESDGWQLGAAAGYAKVDDVEVPLATASVPQLAPLRDPASVEMVNAGSYRTSYWLAGIRAARRF